jgi:hypothetical protein
VVVSGGLGPLAAAAASAFAAGDQVVLLGPGAPSSASERVARFYGVDLEFVGAALMRERARVEA